MTKNSSTSKKKNILVALVSLVVLVSFVAYLVKVNAEGELRQKQESSAFHKKNNYDKYIESIEKLVDSSSKENNIELATLSIEALYKLRDDDGFYYITEENSEYLDMLTEEATKNLNDALKDLLSGSMSDEQYRKVRAFASDENYVTAENIALLSDRRDNYYENIREKENQQKQELGAVQTGYSKSEVRTILGSPDHVMKSNESEFWTYNDMVITMKNDYVYDIVYSLE